LATSSMLFTNIFVYSKSGTKLKWQKFDKKGFAPKSAEDQHHDKSIYLINKSLHYEVVEDVER
jgi:hypothetical protein